MNSVILNSIHSNEVIEGEIISTSEANTLQHLHQIISAKKGDFLKVTICNMGVFSASINEINENKASFKIEKKLSSQLPWIDVLIAAARPQTTKKVLEHGTTFGVRKFHFFKAELSEKSYLQSKIFVDEYHQYLSNGLSQSARYFMVPKIEVSQFVPAEQYSHYKNKFILDFSAEDDFLNISCDLTEPTVIAIGPERGFTKRDLEFFEKAGFKKVLISNTVLRVEHALYSSLSQMELIFKKIEKGV